MDLTELAPGLFRIQLGGTSTHLLNAYAWVRPDGVTLVDTGAAGSTGQLGDALARLGRGFRDVRHVVLTHFHADHTGSAAEVAALSGAQVVAGAADAPFVRGDRPGPEAVLTDAERPLLAAVSAGLPPAPPCRVDVEAVDGDRLPGGMTVLAIPGHTPGSIALHLPPVRAVLSGDTVAEAGGGLILGPFNVDRAAAWASLRRLADLDPDVVAVGHGDPVVGGAAPLLRAATDPLG